MSWLVRRRVGQMVAALLAFGIGTIGSGARGSDSAPKLVPIQAGVKAPEFYLEDTAKRPIQLAVATGKIVVLEFWSTWCVPCRNALTNAQKIARTYGNQGVMVAAICTADRRRAFEEWLGPNRVCFPDLQFYFDPHERGSFDAGEQALRKCFGVGTIPAAVVLNAEGKIVVVLIGYRLEEARIEAGLARAGVKVDPALVEKGEEEIRQRDAERFGRND